MFETQANSIVSGVCECNLASNVTGDALHPAVLYTQGILTILANLLFCLSVLTSPKLRTCQNYLLISNSLADILVGVYLLPVFAARWRASNCDPFKHLACLTLLSAGPHLNGVSVAHWTVVAVERLCRIFFAQVHRRRIRCLLLPSIIICWIYPVLPTYVRTILPYAIGAYPYGHASSANDTCWRLTQSRCDCSFCVSQIWSGVALVGQFFLPMTVAFCCYAAIIVATHRRIKEVNRLRPFVISSPAPSTRQSSIVKGAVFLSLKRVVSSREFQSIRLFLVILTVFVLCMGQYLVNRVRIIFGLDHPLLPDGYTEPPATGYFLWSGNIQRNIMELIAYSNSLINPLLLFILNRNFRRGFCNLFSQVYMFNGRSCKGVPATIDSPPNSKWNEWANRLR